MADIKVSKEDILGEVEVSDSKKFVISHVESSVGEFISVQQHYMKDDEWCKGKGQWLPYDVADEIANVILSHFE